MAQPSSKNRVEREARLRWVPIALMAVSSLAQRECNQARVDHLAADFDLEQLGTPTVNHRGGQFWIIDGQHRIEALKQIGWGDQQVQCWAYEDLTEQEEAERFLKLNDVLAVNAMSKFRTAVTAGREVECDIDRIVRAQGLVVSRDKIPGAIGAVGTLRRIYDRAGPGVLGRALALARDAYGDSGMDASVLDGLGLMVGRYDPDLDIPAVVLKLRNAFGGVHGLLGKAETLRRTTGNQKAHCVAAAAVEIVNQGRGGKKLPAWWREEGRSLTAVQSA
ncbi:MAG: hypothetical protein M3N21_08825 [Actinomycetota bacterium]|nr:hypothetical protein [Actinomycetota bacterium]